MSVDVHKVDGLRILSLGEATNALTQAIDQCFDEFNDSEQMGEI
jgi:hypothetical protein